jgi:BirA family biotin operon repressor/biotin-[acetyl-CoA-carboxylase] ligase
MPRKRQSQPIFGTPHRHFRVTDSTNTRARQLVEAGAPGGTVVTALEQTEGRGRQGRVWTAPEGKALLYSAILRPLDERHLLLPLSVPLAVCAAAEELRPGIECQVKWPNDVWLEERKLSGILIEAKPQEGWAVIGVGLNLSIAPDEFPPDLRQPAISLFSAMEGTAGETLSRHLSHWVFAGEEEVLQEWRRRDGLRGREISWDKGKSSGVAAGIDDRGNLVVVLDGGRRVSLGSGEVQIRL